ncbi:MAG: AAA domain-containing protein [Flavobacteriaceae bacterium]|nr:MAG: AAA domain-containing protein [Flavobacteriaceae bacterium]
MSNALVSWVATGHDFIRPKDNSTEIIINENGPHFSLYRDFGQDFDVHYLLSQYRERENLEMDVKLNRLRVALEHSFNNKKVMLMYMDIDDILSIGTIKNKIDELIKIKLDRTNVQIFVSPGTPSMQTAWYLLGCDLFKRDTISFFRRRERRFIEGGLTPPKEPIEFDVSHYAGVTNVRDNNAGGHLNTNLKPKITTKLKPIYTKAVQLAGNDKTTILIQGDSGTGKTFLAKYIHNISNRKNKPFSILDCSAYNETMLEHKLFGYEKGAFSGATKLHTGVLEQAKGGTVVFDAIDTLPKHLQARLNTVLNEKVFQRIGSDRNLPLDVRIIATSTEDLWLLRDADAFHRELHYRLAVAELQLPSFFQMQRKERKAWVNYFMETTYTKLGVDYIGEIDKEAWDFILDYHFDGNLKEVENMVEIFYTFCEKKVTKADIPRQMIKGEKSPVLSLESAMKKHVNAVVEQCEGNISQAAKYLGVYRGTVSKYLK